MASNPEPLPWEGPVDPEIAYVQVQQFWKHARTSANNLHEIPLLKIIKDIEDIVMEPVPEGTQGSEAVLQQVDRLLGRYANVYSFLTHGYAVLLHHIGRYRAMGDDAKMKDCVAKKDALYRLARAVELKYEAASRMLTVHIQESEDLPERADVRSRAARAETRRSSRSWEDVRD